MLSTCQQRLLVLEKSQESLKEGTNSLSDHVTDFIRHDKEQQKHLREKVSLLAKTIEDKVESFDQASSSHHNVVNDINSKLESLSLKKDHQAKVIGLIQEELLNLAKEQEKFKETPDNDLRESKVNRLQTEDSLFREQLGLQLKKIKGGFLQIIFSQISHNDPDSLYMFSLKLSDDRKYIVKDCKPLIPGLDELIATLNSDNDFNKFMHIIRRRFKDYSQRQT